jgi:class 3 adenylate cyclase
VRAPGVNVKVLVSAELAAAVDANSRLVSLGCHALRGVREMQKIYGLDLG